MSIRKIMVVGAGQMGSGIAQVFAQGEYNVLLVDQNLEFVNKGLSNIVANLTRLETKGKINMEKKEQVLSRISVSGQLNDGHDADFVLEAVTENKLVKTELFSKLDQLCKPETIIASNTSTISISLLGGVTKRPDRVAGMHFFIPAPVMNLVEAIRGVKTSDQTFQSICRVAERCGKVPLEANDFPAFTVNRLLVPMWNEAMFLVMEGNDPATVDRMMKLGAGFPMGPLELADYAGLDTVLSVMEVLQEEFADSKYRPCPLLKKMVNAGLYGRKSGEGFYTYGDEK